MNKEEIKYWIWMSRIRGLGSRKGRMLLEKYKTPKNIWSLELEELVNNKEIGEGLAKQIVNPIYREKIENDIAYMEKNKIKLITYQEKEYPLTLKKIYDFPIMIYVKGNTHILNTFALAVIGCRNCTSYGKIVTQTLSHCLTKEGIIIISGMARGIDTIAHKACLQANGQTIAVTGCGLDTVYPKENKELEKEILEKNGAIISEFCLGTKPEKNNFPARNRIISGLSDGIIVVEAKEKSGTLITVDFALEQGKEVFAIPGNITSPYSLGTNALLKQGAKTVTKLSDILEEYSNNEKFLKML